MPFLMIVTFLWLFLSDFISEWEERLSKKRGVMWKRM